MNKAIYLLVTVIMVFGLAGCSKPIEDYLVIDQDSEYNTLTALTQIEYTNKISKTISALLNDGQTFLNHHLDIVKGKYPIEQEITLVDDSIDRTQVSIEELTAIYPPTSYEEHKESTLEKLNIYKSALVNYRDALGENDYEMINSAADLLKNEFSTLKMASEIYQR